MSMWLVLVLIAIPSGRGLPDMEQVVFRELIVAGTSTVCQQHANKRAEEQRTKRAEDIARLKARVVGVCIEQKEPV
jgi:hypothetical protein